MSTQDDFARQADELTRAAADLRTIARSGKPPTEKAVLRMLARAASHEQWVRTYIDGMVSRLREPIDEDFPPRGAGARGSNPQGIARSV